MPHEVELKLLVAPTDVQRLLRHPALRVGTRHAASTRRLLSIYYDTPDLQLYQNKVAVRLRKVGARWLQTVKTEGRVVNGLHERPEWEQPTTANTLTLDSLTEPTLQRFFADEAIRQALRPVFTTEFTRVQRLLAWPNGDQVEFALDRGEIRTVTAALPICEVELELQAGSPERLTSVATLLQQTIPLQPFDISKAERGYQLLRKERAAMASPQFHLAFPVNDLASTRAFYVDLLGCRIGRENASWIDFDFFGHQITAHLSPQETRLVAANPVDGDQVPVRHFGVILEWSAWQALAERLQSARATFVIAPHVRFKGEVGEQATMFITDPSGNALEFKSFQDMSRVFAREQ
jgi:extradiol dioxygenase family protein